MARLLSCSLQLLARRDVCAVYLAGSVPMQAPASGAAVLLLSLQRHFYPQELSKQQGPGCSRERVLHRGYLLAP